MTSIRPAVPDDLDGIVGVFWACWTGTYRAFAGEAELGRLGRAAAVEMWRAALCGSGATIVAEREGTVVGVARFDAAAGLTAVHSLYVLPEAQGEGLGTRLLTAAVGDSPRAQLWVFSANRQGRSFYASRGWRPDGVTRVQEQFGMPETRLVLGPVPTPAELARRLVSAELCVLPGEAPPPGAVVGVTGRGVAAAGVRDAAGAPTTCDTWFDLASVTKLVTTCALIVLVSRGEVDLDATAGTYWEPAGGLVVRDLLRHRSGLSPWQPLYAGLGGGAVPDRRAALALALSLPRQGTGRTRYSDLGFMVLGEVVAAVTGDALPGALRSLVCEPLGIDLRFAAGLDPARPVASGALGDRIEERMVATGEPYQVCLYVAFDRWRRGEVSGEPNDGNCHHALGDVSGHAGLFGTVSDLLRLGEELARPAVFDEATVARFAEPGPDPGQALGFRTRTCSDGRRLVFHPGFTGCALGFFPGGGAVAVASNRLLADGIPVPTMRLFDHVVAMSQEAA